MPYIEFRNITKAFGDCISCRDISMSVRRGDVHAVIGENGAGKSTLMKVLGGIEPATAGRLFLNDRPYEPRSAQDAFQNGIAFIHQHFVLADQLTALDNLVLSAGANRAPLGRRGDAGVRRRAEELLKRFGWRINLFERVHALSVGEQQRLEILKALMPDPDILIFDEPTAVLTPQESGELMQFILELKRQGKTVLLISHKLHEIETVADEISILRQGRLIAQQPKSSLSVEQMAELMIGRRLQKAAAESRDTVTEPLLRLPASDITLAKGEIFGVAGIEGNGQAGLIGSLLGELRRTGLRHGDITEDRLKLSVFPELDLTEHMLLRHRGSFIRGGLVNRPALETATAELVRQWDVRPPDIHKKLSEFSGGNQQKFMVGRELWDRPQVLLAAHPSRGVDLGAQENIHRALLGSAAQGQTVVLVSSDLDEVLFLSDRYVILNKNKIYGPFRKDQLGEQEIGLYMAGDLSGENAPAAAGPQEGAP